MLWSWGANSHGQLGLGVKNEQVEIPKNVNLHNINSISRISCGGGHTLLLDRDGKLFGCGWNNKLQTGSTEENHNFTRIWSLSGIVFTNLACGWEFSCGVTQDKFLFVWGSNSHGQLGLPKEHFPEVIKPFRLQVIAEAVAMGLRHTAIINSKGDVWVTGCGKHGQLGLGELNTFSDRFQQVPKIGKASHLACGQNHTVIWSSEENALYVWGDNKHGQLLLCTEKYKKIFSPQKIDIDVKKPVRKLLSGWTNILLWLEDGSLLTWGRNNYGQLGCNEPFNGKIMKIMLPGDRKVEDIVLGAEHTICLANDNTLWAWGWNEHANTGSNSGDIVYTPTLVEYESDKKIIGIYAGGAHNFIVTKNCSSKDKNSIEICNDNSELKL